MKVALNLLTMSYDPSNGIEGDVYFNTTSKNLRIYNGFEWLELTPPSTDPTPFYNHVHSFDGDVRYIDTQNIVTFKEINDIETVTPLLPEIIGVDGGNPASILQDPSFINLTLFDDGELISIESMENTINGGNSIDDPNATILNGGNSNDN
jgi:hypothetical protein